MITELIETKKILSNFDKRIANSPFKMEYISERSKIALPTLYRKIRENKFTIDEVLTILEIIEPEQYEFEMISRKIAIAEEQFKNGQFIKHEDFVFNAKELLAARK